MILIAFPALLLALTALRWAWLAGRDLSPAEAYMALCGYSPAVAYFDGPGGAPVAVAAGINLAGASGLGAALLWPLFAVAATVALFALVRPLAGNTAALTCAVLLNLLPAFNRAALTADCSLPLAACALGFAAFSRHALNKNSLLHWLGAGLCAAAGLFFDYLALLLPVALLVVLLASHRWRQNLRRLPFWISMVPILAVLFFLLRWNAQHGWVHFIGGTWQTATALRLSYFPGALLDAIFAATPLVLLALVGGWFGVISRIKDTPTAKFVAIPATLAVLFAFYTSLLGDRGTAPALLALTLTLPMVVWLPEIWWSKTLRPLTRFCSAKTFLIAAAAGAALWTSLVIARSPRPPAAINQEAVREMETLRRSLSGETPLFLIARDAPLASAVALHMSDLSFVAPGHPPVYVVESPYANSQYALWPRYDQFTEKTTDPGAALDPFTEQDGANLFVGRSALYITPQKTDELPQSMTAAFASHRQVAEITLPNGRLLRVYLFSDYQTLPL
jgi:4-amino-4-deoxy-L-arabinose transferase-like glycosyltransferase